MKILKRKTLAALLALSLLASLLPLGAQPALAAEDAPAVLYVGNYQIRNGNATTYLKAGSTEGSLVEGSENDWTVKYDRSTATLTLNGATINGAHDATSPPYGSGIYALCSSKQPVALTIELIGENTITGNYGIYVDAQQGETVGTNASLLIRNSSDSSDSSDNGRLEVSGSSHGIFVKSGTGNASLTINDASVDAKTTQTNSGYAGVCVQSGSDATSSPQLSLSVNGGSLTTSASEGNDGIQFYVGSFQATGATTSLTVSGNAIVDARNGGISASRIWVTLPTPTPTGNNSSGIVFDGSAGTVYGDVTLQEDLEIGDGESLTIGKDASLTVPSGTTLTNNGTVTTTDGGSLTNQGTINNSGTLPDTISGNQPPKITTTTPLPDGTVGTVYNQTLLASGDATITWSSSDLPNWLTLNSDGTITGTPTTADTYTFTVTATNSAGSDSKAFILTVTQPVTSVSLNESNLSMFTGGTVTLAARVAPDNATNKNVTWSSNNEAVATVDNNGKVTAVSAGTATITVTTEDGQKTAACKVTVTDKTYTISADPTALNFGSAYTGYAQPAAQTVILTNTGNQPVTLTQPTADNYVIGMLSATTLEPNATATFTVQSKAGLAPGNYDENILITGSSSASASVATSFTVRERPYIPPTPPSVSEETIDAINDAEPGETVSVALKDGDTTLDAEVFETLAGRDITLEIALEGGVTWSVNGQDIPADANLDDLDLGVEMNSDGIPVDVVNSITGEVGTVQLTLAHDGDFGFTMTLTAPLGAENSGYWANLYHYDEADEQLTFETAAEIDADGSVTIPFSHASQYAIVIDTHSHATVDVSDLFIDIAPDAWYKDAIQYACDQGLMTGVSATEFDPEATTTRAMIVSILARLEGVTTAQAAGFADVDDNDWYATAVNWAANVGVVNGYEDNTFRPNTAITREQLAAVLMNYAAYKGEDVSARADLTSYTDQPSTWAKETMQWAVAEGLISGVTADTLQPQGAATRAQVAAILQRFLSE